MGRLAIIGGGPAGIMAACAASKNHDVTIFEKNEKIGKKLYITGKGRCNVTNNKPIEEFFENIVRNNKFLYSSLYTFSNLDLMNFLEKEGLRLKVERGDRVFPISDKSSDVIKTFEKKLEKSNVNIKYNTEVHNVEKIDDIFYINTNKGIYEADYLLIATGGYSYKATGSTGDGYKFAKHFGHKVSKIYPSLVGFSLDEDWTDELSGISLKNVELTMKIGKKEYREFGDLLFTRNGISGPIVLSLSSRVLGSKDVILSLDLKPALTYEQLDNRLLRDFSNNSNKEIKTVLELLTINKLVPIILKEANIVTDKKINQITSEERNRLLHLFKNFPLKFQSTRDFNEAIISAGGVDTKEINPSTMESKLVKNLYFAGEVIDVDALTGGYNLQIAFSTGYLAGISIGG